MVSALLEASLCGTHCVSDKSVVLLVALAMRRRSRAKKGGAKAKMSEEYVKMPRPGVRQSFLYHYIPRKY